MTTNTSVEPDPAAPGVGPHTASTGTSVPRKWYVKVIAVGAILLTAWHIFASFLWISPPTPLRELVPGNLLSSYMIPWYGQSWSVFAPEPINGDYRFKVRAEIEQGGDTTTVTDWFTATDVEMGAARHNLFPPRGTSLGTQQASKLKGAWEKLTPEQKEIAALGFYEGDAWLGRMHAAMKEKGNEAAATDYIVQERYSDAYATQVARAVWGDDVVRVQYQVSRQNIVPFAQRNDPDAKRPDPTIVATGWRGLIDMPHQSDEAFANTFQAWMDGTGIKGADK
ncbi:MULTISPECIES: DUF5819 family protein [unclassified Isoptericola]|uniref:DUF5819 family protein n=1 Tax=Isoptericola sp. NPDC057191 TaxID=3346041 RepID=UPI0036262201